MRTKSESLSRHKGDGSARVARSSDKSNSSPSRYDRPREQMIAEAAYFRAERRGFAPGNEMSDWLQAEADVEGSRQKGQ